MITATFRPGDTGTRTPPIYQGDYGQELEIRGLDLPAAVEVHFAAANMSEAIIRIGTTIAGITVVDIPDELLKQAQPIMAYVYITTPTSGKTMYTIYTHVQPRVPAEVPDTEEDRNIFRETVAAVNDAADRAEDAADQAEGHAQDAARSAQDAADTAQGITGQVEDAKKDIDQYVAGKEQELKGDTGDVSFASFRVEPPDLYMYNDPEKTHVLFEREGSDLYYRPYFPERS